MPNCVEHSGALMSFLFLCGDTYNCAHGLVHDQAMYYLRLGIHRAVLLKMVDTMPHSIQVQHVYALGLSVV